MKSLQVRLWQHVKHSCGHDLLINQHESRNCRPQLKESLGGHILEAGTFTPVSPQLGHRSKQDLLTK